MIDQHDEGREQTTPGPSSMTVCHRLDPGVYMSLSVLEVTERVHSQGERRNRYPSVTKLVKSEVLFEERRLSRCKDLYKCPLFLSAQERYGVSLTFSRYSDGVNG